MSSLSVTLTGTNAAALVCDFFPPLELTNGEWYVGLLDFTTYNSIPNVIEGKNNVFPVLRDGTTWDLITLPTGAYEIGDIEAFLKKQLGDSNISLRPNNNTPVSYTHLSLTYISLMVNYFSPSSVAKSSQQTNCSP